MISRGQLHFLTDRTYIISDSDEAKKDVGMDGCELMTLVTAIACGITKCSSEDEINILSVAFSQLGDCLATYLAQKQICDERQEKLVAGKQKASQKEAETDNSMEEEEESSDEAK